MNVVQPRRKQRGCTSCMENMRFKYLGELGVPQNGKVVYEPSSNKLITSYNAQVEGDKLFSVSTPDLKLKLHFSITCGVFVGLSFDGLKLSSLTKRQIDMPQSTDGKVKVDCKLRDIISGCTYFGFNGKIYYDETKDVIMFGEISQNDAVYRALTNVYLSVSPGGSLNGVLVEL